MAQQPPRDFMERLARLEDKVRQLELRVRAKGGNKVYVVAGPITGGLYVPPHDMAVGAPDDTIPETREIVGFRYKLRAGTCDVHWKLNGVPIAPSAVTVTTSWATVTLDDPIVVVDADELLLSIDDGTGAFDLSATVLLASRID